MSRNRRHPLPIDRPSPRQWPLVVGFWAPWLAVAIYLAYAHFTHVLGALDWGLLVAAVAALAMRWKFRWVRRGRPRRRADQTRSAPPTLLEPDENLP